MSVAMLDITNKDTVVWLRERLETLMTFLSYDNRDKEKKSSELPGVTFFVDSGSFENLPAYFQVKIYGFYTF